MGAIIADIERIGAPMEAPLIDVVIHYLANEEEPAASDVGDRPARTARLSRVPAIGELIEASDGGGMEHVAQVVHARDGAVHAFVVPVSPPPHVARAFGITDTGVPSLVGFDGLAHTAQGWRHRPPASGCEGERRDGVAPPRRRRRVI